MSDEELRGAGWERLPGVFLQHEVAQIIEHTELRGTHQYHFAPAGVDNKGRSCAEIWVKSMGGGGR